MNALPSHFSFSQKTTSKKLLVIFHDILDLSKLEVFDPKLVIEKNFNII